MFSQDPAPGSQTATSAEPTAPYPWRAGHNCPATQFPFPQPDKSGARAVNSYHPSDATIQATRPTNLADELLEQQPGSADNKQLPDLSELFYYYQPIMGRHGKPVIFEALVRWMNPEGIVLPPVNFLTDLLTSGEDLLNRFTAHTIGNAARVLTDNPQLERMSINLCPAQICRHETLALLASLSGELRSRLMIEVTENHLPERETYSLWLGETAALGVDLVLDDLLPMDLESRLPPQLPIEGVKFDRSILTQLTADEPDAELLDMIKTLRRLKLSLTAEGIEDPKQVQTLLALGFDRFQGYGLGMPVPGPGAVAHLGGNTNEAVRFTTPAV